MSVAPPDRPGDISTIVLCGGGGRRMGGRDKPLEKFNGRPLVDYVLNALPTGPVIISANRSLPRYREFGWPVVIDNPSTSGKKPDYQGPLAGVLAASEQLTTPWVYVIAGDTPLIPKDLAPELVSACQMNNSVAACVFTERAQPLPFVVKVEHLAELPKYLATGERSVMGWLKRLQHTTLDRTTDAANFVNVNTPAELAALTAP